MRLTKPCQSYYSIEENIMCMLKKGDFMYMEIKNPFGLRNGKLITVNDLREDKNNTFRPSAS